MAINAASLALPHRSALAPIEFEGVSLTITPGVGLDEVQAFNRTYGRGGYQVELSPDNHGLRPAIGIPGIYELFNLEDEEVTSGHERIPRVTRLSGVVGNLIICGLRDMPPRYRLLGRDATARVLYLHGVEAADQSGGLITPADFSYPHEPAIASEISHLPRLKHVHVPLTGTVTLELTKN